MRWSLLLVLSCLLAAVGCKDDEAPSGDDDATAGDDDATASDDDSEEPPYADADRDGVPDERDLCVDTAEGAMTDPRGCSAAQASGCVVTLSGPEDGASAGSDTVTFSFDSTGDCGGFRLYASESPEFQPHQRHLLADMIPAGDVDVSVAALPTPAAGHTLFWAVEGASHGHTFLSEVRTLDIQ